MEDSNQLSTNTTSTAIIESYPDNWVEVDENLNFDCLKCGKNVKVLLKDETGNLFEKKKEELINDLETLPDEQIRVFCKLCGAEYILKLSDERLFVEQLNA